MKNRQHDLLEDSVASGVEILVVEDSLTQAMSLQQILETAGYRVSVAVSGEEALKHLETNVPTLVISDVVMPGMDGYTLCKTIKSDSRLSRVPVILVTFLSDPGDVLRGLECGADNFITKPYQQKELISRIHYLLINNDLRKASATGVGLEIYFAGRRHFLTAERFQIIDLLISSFETAVTNQLELRRANEKLTKVNAQLTKEISERQRAQREREEIIQELQEALTQVKKLSGLLPICASCKRIRDDKGYWQQIERYIRDRSEADFSHGICPECARRLYPDLDL